jgi:hypothetical protein
MQCVYPSFCLFALLFVFLGIFLLDHAASLTSSVVLRARIGTTQRHNSRQVVVLHVRDGWWLRSRRTLLRATHSSDTSDTELQAWIMLLCNGIIIVEHAMVSKCRMRKYTVTFYSLGAKLRIRWLWQHQLP